MFDDFSLVPGEAFTALGSVANNFINKIAIATGYVFTPRGKQKDREEAVNYLIEEIRKNDKMSTGLKAASISEVRRILKKYINQQDIVSEAMEFLNDTATPEEVDDDWLVNLMEKAGNTSNKDIQIIYSKILAEEANRPGTASKALVNIIHTMDKELANAFRELIKCMIYIKDENGEEEPNIVYPMNNDEIYNKSLSFMDIVNLSSTGLIEYRAGIAGGYVWKDKEVKARYGDEYFILRCEEGMEEIIMGNVNFTRSGRELAKILLPETETDYLSKIKEYWGKNKINIIEQ